MSLVALLILAIAVIPAFAVATLGWLALAADTDDLHALTGQETWYLEKS
jgi:hypothetical protein